MCDMRRNTRLERIAVVGVVALAFAGCATKGDIRNLQTEFRTELRAIAARQDSVLAVLRLWHRRRNPPPPLPAGLPALQAFAARASHGLLYALMFAMPLLGWAMSSAGGYPVTLPGGWVLPALLPSDPALYTALRGAHGVLGYAFFALILAHVAGALHHAWVRRDGVFEAMAGKR